jgi:hypothetical protein
MVKQSTDNASNKEVRRFLKNGDQKQKPGLITGGLLQAFYKKVFMKQQSGKHPAGRCTYCRRLQYLFSD